MTKQAKNTICLWYDGADLSRFIRRRGTRAPGDFPSGMQGSNALLNDVTWYGTIGKLPHSTSLSHLFIEGKSALSHFINVIT